MFENVKEIHGQWGVQMHEMQMMDTRMNMAALLTSTVDEYVPGQKGSNIANYVEFVDFIKNSDGKIEGAVLNDLV
jgi:glycerol-3-phosphate dehydrogenase